MRLPPTLAARVDRERCVVGKAPCAAVLALEASLESFEATDVMTLLLAQFTLTFSRVMTLCMHNQQNFIFSVPFYLNDIIVRAGTKFSELSDFTKNSIC